MHVARHRACMLASSPSQSIQAHLARLSGTGCCSNRLAVDSSKEEYSSDRLVVDSSSRLVVDTSNRRQQTPARLSTNSKE
jgi:hypothetical protein